MTIEDNNSGFHNGAIIMKSTHFTSNKRANGIFFFNQQGQNEWFIGRPYSDNAISRPNDEIVFQRMVTANHSDSTCALVDGAGGNTGAQRFLVIKNDGKVGIGTNTPARTLHVSDVMRLEPRATAPTSPAKGDMYFDSTLNKLRVYDGTAWQNCW
jgi:hypothetical protein